MFSCLQILEAFLWFVLITLLNVTLIILTLSVSRLLNLLLWVVAFLLFLNHQCLASVSRWLTAARSWQRSCRSVSSALPSLGVLASLPPRALPVTSGVRVSRVLDPAGRHGHHRRRSWYAVDHDRRFRKLPVRSAGARQLPSQGGARRLQGCLDEHQRQRRQQDRPRPPDEPGDRRDDHGDLRSTDG